MSTCTEKDNTNWQDTNRITPENAKKDKEGRKSSKTFRKIFESKLDKRLSKRKHIHSSI